MATHNEDEVKSKKRKTSTAKTIDEKLKILDELKTGATQVEVCRRYDLPRSTLNTWLKQKSKMEEAGIAKKDVKRLRTSRHEDLDKALVIWFEQNRANNIPVDGPLLLEKANSYLTLLGEPGEVSRSWIDRWKKRHNIASLRVVGECLNVAMNDVESWRNDVFKKIQQDYAENDIYNMDETGLFYKLITDKTLHYKGEKCSGGKLAKDRITVALCTNMTGSDKLTPLVIGKSAKPRCFKNIRSYPCEYKSNSKA